MINILGSILSYSEERDGKQAVCSEILTVTEAANSNKSGKQHISAVFSNVVLPIMYTLASYVSFHLIGVKRATNFLTCLPLP